MPSKNFPDCGEQLFVLGNDHLPYHLLRRREADGLVILASPILIRPRRSPGSVMCMLIPLKASQEARLSRLLFAKRHTHCDHYGERVGRAHTETN
jgi:hypothetical protein